MCVCVASLCGCMHVCRERERASCGQGATIILHLPQCARFCKDSFFPLIFIHTKTPVAQTVSSYSDLPLAHLLQTHPTDGESVLLHCTLNREKGCQESSYRILHLDRLCGVAAAAV